MLQLHEYIKSLLVLAIDPAMADTIIEKSFDRFEAVFKTKAYDPDANYEFFEQLGDLSINKFIISYMSSRFPHLRSTQGVGVLASLRIVYGSKETLSKLSQRYKMDMYVRSTPEESLDKAKYISILEDVFEAFFGALEFSMDNIWSIGIGYITVYKILEKMFDALDIKIDYESVIDAKTRMNEFKDEAKFQTFYKDIRLPNGDYRTDLYVNGRLAGTGIANTKKNAQIYAAEEAMDWIRINLGLVKEVPERFRTVDSNKIW